MSQLVWSQTKSGVWNGKVRALTLFTVAWHTSENRFFVASKLPGGGTYTVKDEAEGKRVSEKLWIKFVYYLEGKVDTWRL